MHGSPYTKRSITQCFLIKHATKINIDQETKQSQSAITGQSRSQRITDTAIEEYVACATNNDCYHIREQTDGRYLIDVQIADDDISNKW